MKALLLLCLLVLSYQMTKPSMKSLEDLMPDAMPDAPEAMDGMESRGAAMEIKMAEPMKSMKPMGRRFQLPEKLQWNGKPKMYLEKAMKMAKDWKPTAKNNPYKMLKNKSFMSEKMNGILTPYNRKFPMKFAKGLAMKHSMKGRRIEAKRPGRCSRKWYWYSPCRCKWWDWCCIWNSVRRMIWYLWRLWFCLRWIFGCFWSKVYVIRIMYRLLWRCPWWIRRWLWRWLVRIIWSWC